MVRGSIPSRGGLTALAEEVYLIPGIPAWRLSGPKFDISGQCSTREDDEEERPWDPLRRGVNPGDR